MVNERPPAAEQAYYSSNFQKHTSRNPLQRRLIGRFHETVASLVDLTGARAALDAGCGEGFALRHIAHGRDLTLVGLDASPEALLVARQLSPEQRFVGGNVLALPFPPGSFDLVLCMEVLEHLDDPARGLAELRRTSREWLLLSVPNEPLFRGANFMRGKNVRALGNDPGHVNHWSATSFARFVSQQCDIVRLETSFPWTIALCKTSR